MRGKLGINLPEPKQPNRFRGWGIGHDLLGEDPDVFRDFSDDGFGHGCSLRFTIGAEVFGVQMDAVI